MRLQTHFQRGQRDSSGDSAERSRLSTTRRVAVCVETDTSFGRQVIRGIANYADVHGGWHLVLDPRDFEHRSALPEGWVGDGIIARFCSRLQVERIQACNVPVVSVDGLFCDLEGVPTVVTDEKAVAEQSVTHLLDQGFRNFGYFAPPSTDYSKQRGDEFEAALKERGYTCHSYKPGYRPGRKLSWIEQQRRISRWLASLPLPLAVLAIDAQRARQLAEICHLRSLRVPDDIAILAGDADDIMCEVSAPPLSHINVASERIGHDAAQLLDAMMEGEPTATKTTLIPPHGVTSRQSTDLLAIDDPTVAQALRFIRAHAHRGIVVQDILREVPISRRGLEIAFQNYIGRSPAREIRRVQLEKGRELLGRKELSISEVALACGFANATRFGVAFKKDANTTPFAYRRKLLAGKQERKSSV